MSIDSCSDFEATLPYDLTAPCIRRSHDGMWNFLDHIRKGWGETALFYPSLAELLETEEVSITGCYEDATGEFFTIATQARRLNSPTSTARLSHLLDISNSLEDRERALASFDVAQWLHVDSSSIDAIAFVANVDRGAGSDNILFVRFTSQAVYAYFGVSPTLWHQLQSADSKGRFFNAHIRNQVPYLCL